METTFATPSMEEVILWLDQRILCHLFFLEGVLMKDPVHLLTAQGDKHQYLSENQITDVSEIIKLDLTSKKHRTAIQIGKRRGKSSSQRKN